jgi:hypothetical protein
MSAVLRAMACDVRDKEGCGDSQERGERRRLVSPSHSHRCSTSQRSSHLLKFIMQVKKEAMMGWMVVVVLKDPWGVRVIICRRRSMW